MQIWVSLLLSLRDFQRQVSKVQKKKLKNWQKCKPFKVTNILPSAMNFKFGSYPIFTSKLIHSQLTRKLDFKSRLVLIEQRLDYRK